MTFANPPRPRPTQPRRRRGPLVPTLIVLAAVVVVVLILAQVWTEWLWFVQLGFSRLLVTEW